MRKTNNKDNIFRHGNYSLVIPQPFCEYTEPKERVYSQIKKTF